VRWKKSSGPGPLTLPFVFYNIEGEDREEFMKGIHWIVNKINTSFIIDL
jgi:hypothetical protein